MKFATISKSLVMGLALLLASSAFAATKANLTCKSPTTVNGTKLKAGDYKLQWDGSGPQRGSQHHARQERGRQSAGESRGPEFTIAEQRSRREERTTMEPALCPAPASKARSSPSSSVTPATACRPDRASNKQPYEQGSGHPLAPPTPPYRRVRIRRFSKLSPLGP